MNKTKINKINNQNFIKYLFMGQKIYFEKTSAVLKTENRESIFLGYTYDRPWSDQWKIIEDYDPDIVIIYRPEVMDPEFLKKIKTKAITVAYFTEPLPFAGFEGEVDLLRRFEPFKKYDFELCDFNVIYNEITCGSLQNLTEILFSHPLPVDDALFTPVTPELDKIRGIFYGRVTEARNKFLMPLKHHYDWTVIDHGQLEDTFFRNFNIGLNLHSDPYLNFENRILYHMAQSLLVLSEPILPGHGINKDIHYLEFKSIQELNEILFQLSRNLESITDLIIAGHNKALEFKTSNFLNKLELEIKKRIA